MAPEEVIYTLAEVAKILRVGEKVVKGLIDRGELRYKRVGRQYRVTREMLDEYLNSQK